MDYFNTWNAYKRTGYRTITGTITQINPLRGNAGGECSQMVTVEDASGNVTNFMVSPSTYIADAATMYQGMQAHFAYNADLPAPLIYPPQFPAVAVVSTIISSNIEVGYFNSRLVNSDNTLRLNVTEGVPVVTGNNQVFYGSPANHYLIVMYEQSTRSIPAQTTPERIVVMCEWQ